MLILTRRKLESFVINNEIKIIFLGMNYQGQGKFGIEAPSEITVHREEIQERVNSGKQKTEKKPFRYCHE